MADVGLLDVGLLDVGRLCPADDISGRPTVTMPGFTGPKSKVQQSNVK